MFAAYLWGIETGLLGEKVDELSVGLQPTYEGLKLHFGQRLSGVQGSLQPTYEGLKR